MSIDSRLNRLAPALSARERAILVLESYKDGTPESPAWRHSMPVDQRNEFNRLIGLMNVANREISLIIGHLAEMASRIELREAWLVSLRLWEEHLEEIRQTIRLTVREPITESAYHARLDEAREEAVPIVELAALLAGEFEGWQPDDFEQQDDVEGEVNDKAWDGVVGEKEREIRALIAAGSLATSGKGRRQKVRMGAFDDLMGRFTAVAPEDYLSYRILPDDAAEEVKREQGLLRRLNGVLEGVSFDAASDAHSVNLPNDLGQRLRETTAFQLIDCWVQLRTAEVVVGELAAEFGGSDPLKPALREELDDTKRRLTVVQEHLRFMNMEVVLRDPLEEELEEMRTFVQERAARV